MDDGGGEYWCYLGIQKSWRHGQKIWWFWKVAAGVPVAVLRPVAMAEEGMDVDDEGRKRDKSPAIPAAETASDVELPPAFKYALQLTLGVSLRYPRRVSLGKRWPDFFQAYQGK